MDERTSALQVPPTETEVLKQQADTATVSRADELLAEQQDEAKAMDQMVLYAKCVTIRDAQLEERKDMMLEEEAEGRRLDTMMEIERVKALENYEERERQRKVERLIGAKVCLSDESPYFKCTLVEVFNPSQTGLHAEVNDKSVLMYGPQFHDLHCSQF
jgi:hypothetical protein